MGEYFLTIHTTVVPSLSESSRSRRLNDEDIMTVQNVMNYTPNNMAQHPRRLAPSATLQQHHFDIKSHKFTTVPYNITEYNMH